MDFKLGPFIYTCEKSIGVYQETLEFIEASGLASRISDFSWAYYSIGSVIPQTTENWWSGHFFPWSESWDELQISFNLALFGLYKQAMISLRSTLELGLLSVYWNINDDGHLVIQEWLGSHENTPLLAEIWKRLEKHPNFIRLQQHYDIKARLLGTNYLHDFVHSKGVAYSNYFGLKKANFQTFEAKAFMRWLDSFADVISILCILHLAKYPIGVIKFDYDSKFGIDKPTFGGLEEFEIERIERVIGPQATEILEDIAQNDSQTEEIMKWLNNMPDITEAQIEEQIIEHDKLMIEHEGLEHWIENETHIIEEIKKHDKDYERSPVLQERYEMLVQWAKENGFQKAPQERNRN